MDKTKRCGSCGEEKPASEFYRDASNKDGLYTRCKVCHCRATKAWSIKNRDTVNRLVAARRARNPERTKEINRRSNAKRYAANPEQRKSRTRAWYSANKERATLYHQQYRIDNKDAKTKYFADYYQRNAEHLKARARELGPLWAAVNPDKTRAKAMRRVCAKKNATPAWANHSAIDAVYEMCVVIERETGIPHDVDHIVPLQSKRVCGLHVDYNLRILPRSINQSKGNRLIPDLAWTAP